MDNHIYQAINPANGEMHLSVGVSNMQAEGYAIAVPVAQVNDSSNNNNSSNNSNSSSFDSQAGFSSQAPTYQPEVLVMTNPFDNSQ